MYERSRDGVDGRITSRSAQSSTATSLAAGAPALTLTIEAPTTSTLLILGIVATEANGGAGIEVLLDGVPLEPSFRTELDSLTAIPIHVGTTVPAGAHTITLRVDRDAVVEERVVTALLFEERP